MHRFAPSSAAQVVGFQFARTPCRYLVNTNKSPSVQPTRSPPSPISSQQHEQRSQLSQHQTRIGSFAARSLGAWAQRQGVGVMRILDWVENSIVLSTELSKPKTINNGSDRTLHQQDIHTEKHQFFMGQSFLNHQQLDT